MEGAFRRLIRRRTTLRGLVPFLTSVKIRGLTNSGIPLREVPTDRGLSLVALKIARFEL